MDKEASREQSAIFLELARRERDERLRYFVPHGGQEDFISYMAKPGAFTVIAGSGNGWGKTQIIAAALAAIIWPKLAPPCFTQHELFNKWPYPKRARINSTPKELEAIGSLQVAIKDLFPKGRYEARRKSKSYDSEWITDTGWTVDTFSYEQDPDEMAGPTLGLQLWNEPMPEALWREGQARLRRGGINWGAITSLNKYPWVVDGLLNKHNGKDVLIRYGNVCENCKQHGKNGHLEHSQIERILTEYPEDEREARRTGKPLSLSGRIFKAFDYAVHVIQGDVLPPADTTVYQVVDPAIGKPLFVIYAYVDMAGHLVIFDEYPQFKFDGAPDDNLTVTDYNGIFQRMETEHGRQASVRILDRHFGNARRTLGGTTLREEFSNCGLDFIDSYALEPSVEVETGIRKVKEFLAWDKSKPQDALNRPKLQIAEKCKNTIAAVMNWARDHKTLKPLEKFKDGCDCVRYLVMAEPTVEVVRTWQEPPRAHYGVQS